MDKVLLVFLLTSFATSTPVFLPEYERHDVKMGNIVPGSGYSSDTEQIAPQVCFNTTVGSIGDKSAQTKLGEAIKFSDFQQDLGVDVTLKVGFGMFSISSISKYMRSIEDKSFSLSLNYYEVFTNRVALQIAGMGTEALNENGRNLYENGTNQYFGILCGDNYVSSYHEGALLAFGLNLIFHTETEKKEFTEQAGFSYGSLASAIVLVNKTTVEQHMSGEVEITAFQLGGEPSKLADILSKDPNNNYYGLTCRFSQMESCVKAADGLLSYAQNEFEKQFSLDQDLNLTQLGLGFAEYQSIGYLGLTVPASLVTPQVVADRQTLGSTLQENQYYQQQLEQLVNFYPVAWQLGSDLYQALNNAYKQATDNINTITRIDDPQAGAAGCWDSPNECSALCTSILANVNPINYGQLNNAYLSQIQYSWPFPRGQYYKIGDTAESWGAVPVFSGPYAEAGQFLNSENVYISQTTFNYTVNEIDQKNNIIIATFAGTSTDGTTYTGDEIVAYGLNHHRHMTIPKTFQKLVSDYYFDQYDPDSQEQSHDESGIEYE